MQHIKKVIIPEGKKITLIDQNVVLRCNLKNDRIFSVRFQGKPFNIRVIQIYAPTTNAEESDVEWFYDDLQDLQEIITKKMSFTS